MYLWGYHRIKGWKKLQGPTDEDTLKQYQTYFAKETLKDSFEGVPYSGFANDSRLTYTKFVIGKRQPKGNPAMYSKSAVKSYAQGREKVSSYKRNILPFGAIGASAAMTAVTEGVKEVWRKGKKTKLGRALTNSGKRKRNSPEVEDLSKDWHGRDVQGTTEVEEIEQYEEELVDLGFLEELGIIGGDGNQFTVTFKKDRPTLACDGNGQSLEIIGGDQSLDLASEGIEQKGKMLVPLGYVYSIVYLTDKHHLEGSNGYPESYEHYFAEEFYRKSLNPDKFKNMDDWFDELIDMGMVDKAKESGRLPVAVYNKTDCKIMLAGGNYEVTELGIKD